MRFQRSIFLLLGKARQRGARRWQASKPRSGTEVTGVELVGSTDLGKGRRRRIEHSHDRRRVQERASKCLAHRARHARPGQGQDPSREQATRARTTWASAGSVRTDTIQRAFPQFETSSCLVLVSHPCYAVKRKQ
jgi:hypothetical protein